MTEVREIAQLGNPVLRQLATPVDNVNSAETQQMITLLRDTLASTQGVGIAAPQISISKRILIVASRPTARYPSAPLMEPTVMINPSFSALSENKVKGWEGCLSIPSIRALVPRYTEIKISYTNEQNRPIELIASDFVARVFQHEYDHLDGKVYLDSILDNQDIVAESEYFKLIESAAV